MAAIKAPKDDQQSTGEPSPYGGEGVEAAINGAAEKGYFGERPDETPHEHYTLQGVIASKPTPETAGKGQR